jgi:hypothetical protein
MQVIELSDNFDSAPTEKVFSNAVRDNLNAQKAKEQFLLTKKVKWPSITTQTVVDSNRIDIAEPTEVLKCKDGLIPL